MYEAKINNLGLSLLIRLAFYLMCLSFLGGETQGPSQNNQSSGTAPLDPRYTTHLDPKKVSRRIFDIVF